MQLGILGFPKSGKTTLFNTLTTSHQVTDKYATSSQTNMGTAQVRDGRLAALRDLFNPKRYVPATVQYVDIPGITRGESAESLDLAKLKMVDALVHGMEIKGRMHGAYFIPDGHTLYAAQVLTQQLYGQVITTLRELHRCQRRPRTRLGILANLPSGRERD